MSEVLDIKYIYADYCIGSSTKMKSSDITICNNNANKYEMILKYKNI